MREIAGGRERVEREFETALGVGETHFEQGRHQTTGAHVVTGEEEFLRHELLHRGERTAEGFGVSNRGHVATHAAERLSEGRAAEGKRCGREVNIIKARSGVVDHHGAHHTTHVAHFAAEYHAGVADEGDVVAEFFDALHVVGGEDDGVTGVAEFEDFALEEVGVEGVEAREGFVEMSKGGRCTTVVMNCTFCCMPLESSSRRLFHQSVMSSFSNHACRRLLASRAERPLSWAR